MYRHAGSGGLNNLYNIGYDFIASSLLCDDGWGGGVGVWEDGVGKLSFVIENIYIYFKQTSLAFQLF
jgi:hypothetical protein